MSYSIANIVIDYANEDEIICYAGELAKQTLKPYLIIVVNKIGNKGISYLKNKLDELELDHELHMPGKNLGYLNGLLWGYKHTKTKCEWYALTNTDICIESPTFYEAFINSALYNNKNFWLIGPSVYNIRQGEYVNPYIINRLNKKFYISRSIAMRFPTLFDFIYRTKKRLYHPKKKKEKQTSQNVYAVHGSYMFLRNELLDILSERKEWELLYAEEQYIAEVVRLNNKMAYYDADIEVSHMEGSSTGKVDLKKKYKLNIKAIKRLMREFY